MTDDTSARELHDKATRGGSLTQAEQTELEAWYARQDQEEAMLLASSPRTSLTLDTLREEIEKAIVRLQAITQQLQEQTDEKGAAFAPYL